MPPLLLSWVISISLLCTILETSHVTLRQLWMQCATLESHFRAVEHGVMSKAMCRYVTSARGSRAQPAQMEAHPERRSLDSDCGSEMDADCCGDSGQLLLIVMHPFLQAGFNLACLHARGRQ